MGTSKLGISWRDVGYVWGVGPRYRQKLVKAGIGDIQALSECDPGHVADVLGMKEHRRSRHIVAQARALRSGKAQVIEDVTLPPPPRVYLDVESDRRCSYCWLVSAVDEDGECQQWFADRGPSDERKILEAMVDWLESRPGTHVLFYNHFERWILPKRLENHGLAVPRSLKSGVDVFKECFQKLRIALPVERYDLKSVAQWAGYKSRHPDLFGWLAAYTYEEWLASRSGRGPEDTVRELREYGEDDVLGLMVFVQRLEEFLAVVRPRLGSGPSLTVACTRIYE